MTTHRHTKTSGGRTKQNEAADKQRHPLLERRSDLLEYSDPLQSRELEKEGGGSHLGGGGNSK